MISVLNVTGIASFDLFFSIFVYIIVALVPVMLAICVIATKFFR